MRSFRCIEYLQTVRDNYTSVQSRWDQYVLPPFYPATSHASLALQQIPWQSSHQTSDHLRHKGQHRKFLQAIARPPCGRQLVGHIGLLLAVLAVLSGKLDQRTVRADKSHRSEEHTSELQSPDHLVCRLLLE